MRLHRHIQLPNLESVRCLARKLLALRRLKATGCASAVEPHGHAHDVRHHCEGADGAAAVDPAGFAGSEAPHGLQHLAQLPALARWSLRGGGDLDLAPIGCCARALTLLDLAGAELAPELDAAEQLQALQQLPGLRAMNLSAWGLQPAAAAVVAALPKLQALSLASSATADAAVAELAAATGLTSVDLSGCRCVTLEGVRAALCTLPHLEVLRLEDAGREGFAKDAWPQPLAFQNHFIGINRRTDTTALDG